MRVKTERAQIPGGLSGNLLVSPVTPQGRPRSALICHRGADFDRKGLAQWLGSFSTVAGIVELEEPVSRTAQRIRRGDQALGASRVCGCPGVPGALSPGARAPRQDVGGVGGGRAPPPFCGRARMPERAARAVGELAGVRRVPPGLPAGFHAGAMQDVVEAGGVHAGAGRHLRPASGHLPRVSQCATGASGRSRPAICRASG